ncbi:134R protein [Yaba-like disease virus]|uniref:134R protein n=1 Tax=Yaba-like disease virus TaxID=132475 RepID=Q9DHH9_YLDV|nr:134R protein [Yaba-like disease virus]CAC21372.1 134R protein [Yaba-like disease virus]
MKLYFYCIFFYKIIVTISLNCGIEHNELNNIKNIFFKVRNVVQADDVDHNLRILTPALLNNITVSETCFFIYDMFELYLNDVFVKYTNTALKLNILKSLSSVANNFLAIFNKVKKRRVKKNNVNVLEIKKLLLIDNNCKKLFSEIDIFLTWVMAKI